MIKIHVENRELKEAAMKGYYIEILTELSTAVVMMIGAFPNEELKREAVRVLKELFTDENGPMYQYAFGEEEKKEEEEER